MAEYKHRDLSSVRFLGERVDFIASNDRLEERVANLSHERYVLESMVEAARPDDTVWDIGACLGIHTFTAAKHLIDGEVIAFEPMPTNCGVLIDNMTVNRLDNVEVKPVALADENGEAEFAIRESLEAGYGRHSLDVGEYDKLRTIDVPTRRGDTVVADGEAPSPNIVKIDVEGAGPLVIEGLREELSRNSCRHVFIETHEPNSVQPSHEDFGYTTDDICDLLRDLGFTVGTMDKEFHLHAVKEVPRPAHTVSLNIEVVQGDISDQSADAIISSSGTSLRMGTGVAGAIREAGDGVHHRALEHSPAELGTAISTSAPGLDADYVVHAVGMPHYGRGRATPESIRNAVNSALHEADALGCESVALPAVGCGLGGVPLSTGAEVIFDELRRFDGESLKCVDFIAYTDEERETIERFA